jgi:hypothetical protein
MKANTSTGNRSFTLDAALAGIDKRFRARIIGGYLELKKRHSQALYDGAWDASGLSAGKVCEAVLRFLQHHLAGASVPFGQHIPNFADECRKLVTLPATSGPESLRVIIPRALVFLYTLRGKRGIGHVGGDVEANGIDSATIIRTCDWVICELIRTFHGLSLEEAQSIVDGLSQRTIPEIWTISGKKRVMQGGLPFKRQVLLLLYHDAETWVASDDLLNWTEYSNPSVFKKNVLRPLHRDRLLEYDEEIDMVCLSPTGIQEVEERILRSARDNMGVDKARPRMPK